MPIDPERTFQPLRVAVLTVSDTRTRDDDRSGQVLVEGAIDAGHEVVARQIVPDERDRIVEQLRAWVDSGSVDVVLTTGGTGVTARDVTPEAVREVIDKEIVGFGELFRWLSFQTIGTSTIQSRALGGVARSSYIFALPGSTGACRDAWEQILVHQLDARFRPCNFAELMPRLRPRAAAGGLGVDTVEAAIATWCAAVKADDVDALAALYAPDARLALPSAGHEGARVSAEAILHELGSRTFRYDSLGGAQVEAGGSTGTDVGALIEGGRARFVTSWVWRVHGDSVRIHMQQISPAG